MKRHGNLWDEITSFPNLLRAAEKAQRGKRLTPAVRRFNQNLEWELLQLQSDLREKTYQPGHYRAFMIQHPKPRLISAAPYRDRIVHHALCNVIEPVFDRTFVFDSYACRVGKGTHRAVDRFTQFARRYPFALKCDVKRFFPSIDHEILLGLVARKLKDGDALALARRIVENSNPQEEVLDHFPGDNLFTPHERRRGLPIGNLTSQFFANVYLNGFDHFVKEELRCQAYVRYCDDFVIFSDDKEFLWRARDRCASHLALLRLRLHPRKQRIYRVTEGMDFLGYRVFPTHRRLRRDNVVRAYRRAWRMRREFAEWQTDVSAVRQRLCSWLGHAGHADSHGLRTALLAKAVFSRVRSDLRVHSDPRGRS